MCGGVGRTVINQTSETCWATFYIITITKRILSSTNLIVQNWHEVKWGWPRAQICFYHSPGCPHVDVKAVLPSCLSRSLNKQQLNSSKNSLNLVLSRPTAACRDRCDAISDRCQDYLHTNANVWISRISCSRLLKFAVTPVIGCKKEAFISLGLCTEICFFNKCFGRC